MKKESRYSAIRKFLNFAISFYIIICYAFFNGKYYDIFSDYVKKEGFLNPYNLHLFFIGNSNSQR